MFAYAANNPIKYTDPDGRETDDIISSIDNFLTSTESITAFFFALCSAVNKGEPYTKAVVAEKFNELNIAEGMVRAYTPSKGDPFIDKLISNNAAKCSKIFLAATILINFVDVLLVYRNSGGDSDATTKRLIRNTVITSATIAGGKTLGFIGAKLGSWVSPGYGTLIGGAIGGIGGGVLINIYLNKKFDEIGW